eukprot:9974964-Alexandrium_andersonii.AAC.1
MRARGEYAPGRRQAVFPEADCRGPRLEARATHAEVPPRRVCRLRPSLLHTALVLAARSGGVIELSPSSGA